MKSVGTTARSLTPLLVTSMAVVTPLLFVLGLVVGNRLQGGSTLGADSMSSWLSAIATVAIAVLTFILAKETWYLREAQIQQLVELRRENIRPNVGFQLESSPVGMSFMNVKVSNLGKGIARKVAFEFSDRNGKPVSPGQDAVADKFFKLALFRQGVQSIGIGQVISSYLFSFIDLANELKGEAFKPYLNVSITFEDVEGVKYENAFTLDFREYEGISELGGDALHQMANEIKKIREHLGKVSGKPGGRVAVDVFSATDRNRENEETKAWLAEQRKKSSAKGECSLSQETPSK